MSLHLALVHFPTVDKRGEVVCTSVTNLDVHDIGRAGTTFGAESIWIVHPYPAQQRFIERVLRHWMEGIGSLHNKRRQSLEVVELADDLGVVCERIEAEFGRRPIIVGTSARMVPNSTSYNALRERLDNEPEQPFLVVFGTGWGLHPEAMLQMDLVLEPIYGPGAWNHLSVRAAIGIILDRLRGRR